MLEVSITTFSSENDNMVTISNSTVRANEKLNISEKILRELYETKGLTYQQISEELGCCIDTVRRRMKKYDIKARSYAYHMYGNTNAVGEKNPRWIGGTDQYWKRQLINLYGHKCQVCEFNVVVHVHHIDENRKNNNIDNLVLLCPNCHFSIHHADYDLKYEDNKWLLYQIQQ